MKVYRKLLNDERAMVSRIISLLLFTAVLVSVIGVVSGSFFFSRTATVTISKTGFSPRNIVVNKGDTVVFRNTDELPHWPASNPHPTHERYPGFDPKQAIEPGASWQFRFIDEGTWYYHDHLVATIGGRITVAARQNLIGLFTKKETSTVMMERIERETDVKKQQALVVRLVLDVGPRQALQLFARSKLPRNGQTHLLAHTIGEVAFDLKKEDALADCSEDMFSGCSHGLIAAASSEGGLDAITRLLVRCEEGSRFQYHMCIHAVGHALTTLSDYDIRPALENCDRLVVDNTELRTHCYNGVFMENVLGDHGDFPPPLHPFLSATDLSKPCSSVDARYKQACYFNQASWWIQALGGSLNKTIAECEKMPVSFHDECADSVGRVIATETGGDRERIVSSCRSLGETGDLCLISVAKASLAVGDDALPPFLCDATSDSNSRKRCYQELFRLMTDMNLSKDRKGRICAGITGPYRQECGVL